MAAVRPTPPKKLVARLVRMIDGQNNALVEMLRNSVPEAFITFGNTALDQVVALAEAVACFEYAVACGIVGANVNLGRALARIPGRARAAEQAYLAAAAAGFKDAYNNLGVLYTNNPRLRGNAEHSYRTAIDFGDINALVNLGQLLQKTAGRESESLSCFLLADNAGHPAAFNELAAAQADFGARGLNRDELTAFAIRHARALRRRIPPLPRRSTAKILDALRTLSAGKTDKAMLEAGTLLLTAGVAYQSELGEVEAGNPPANRVFENVKGLVEFLDTDHAEGRYIYRGQLGRRSAYRTMDRAENEFAYENVFPADFRFITKYVGVDKSQLANELSTVRKRSRERCFQFIRHVANHCSGNSTEGIALRQWLMEAFPGQLLSIQLLPHLIERGIPDVAVFGDGFTAAGLWKLLWALAQHYELATALLDVTFSPQVAAWFATQDWSGERPSPQTGRGVIYRFDLPALRGLLTFFSFIEAAQAEKKGMPGSPRMPPFIQDLRAIPASCASRPLGQQGASIYGLDSVWLLECISASGVLEVFEFDHTGSADIGISRDTIRPADDPFLAIAQTFQSVVDKAEAKTAGSHH
jgi:hypothetical protein